ncbi:MAG: undecaprenyl-diphosphatase UppP [Thermodesulfovibrionales bacterium]
MFEALVLGIVQGLTEFLPVSSTAHLILFPWFFHWGGEIDSLTFDIALHAGTLLALVICFWKDWLDILLRKQRLLLLIIIASIPAGVAGLLLEHIVESRFRIPSVISVSLIVIGIFMLVSEKAYKQRKIDDLGILDAVVIGISQAVALVPGVSRSGITISTGLLRGIERESAAKFSFLLSTPVIAGAVLLHLKKMMTAGEAHDLRLFAIGFISSAITGLAAIKFLMNYLKKRPINIFAYYRFGLAAVILLGIWLKG